MKVLFVLLVLSGSAVNSAEIKPGKIEFLAVGKPSLLKVKGEATDFSGTWSLDKSNLKASLFLTLEKLDTGLSTRNKHLKERTLEVEKFPTAQVTISELVLTTPVVKKSFSFKGNLKLHGVEKPIAGEVELEPTGAEWKDGMKFDAKFKVAGSDFNIARAEFAGMKMEDSIDLRALGEMKNEDKK